MEIDPFIFRLSIFILSIFIAAKMIATKPKILEVLKIFSVDPARAAIIAPTIMTDEMAFVTDIKGV